MGKIANLLGKAWRGYREAETLSGIYAWTPTQIILGFVSPVVAGMIGGVLAWIGSLSPVEIGFVVFAFAFLCLGMIYCAAIVAERWNIFPSISPKPNPPSALEAISVAFHGTPDQRFEKMREHEKFLQGTVTELRRELELATTGADPVVASKGHFWCEPGENSITFRAISGSYQTVDVLIEQNIAVSSIQLRRIRIFSSVKLTMNEELRIKIVTVQPPKENGGWNACFGDPSDINAQSHPIVIKNQPAAVVVSSDAGESIFHFYFYFNQNDSGKEPKLEVIGENKFDFVRSWGRARRNQAS